MLKGRYRQAAQPLAFEQRPLLKGGAVVQIKVHQKITGIARRRRGQLTGGKMRFKARTIQVKPGGGMKGKALVGDQQVRIELLAQAVEGHTQVGARLFLRAFGP